MMAKLMVMRHGRVQEHPYSPFFAIKDAARCALHEIETEESIPESITTSKVIWKNNGSISDTIQFLEDLADPQNRV